MFEILELQGMAAEDAQEGRLENIQSGTIFSSFSGACASSLIDQG